MTKSELIDLPLRDVFQDLIKSKSARVLSIIQQKKINEYLNQTPGYKNLLYRTSTGYMLETRDEIIEYFQGPDANSSMLTRKSKSVISDTFIPQYDR